MFTHRATASFTATRILKNPFDSLPQTIALGFVLTLVVVLLIHAIA